MKATQLHSENPPIELFGLPAAGKTTLDGKTIRIKDNIAEIRIARMSPPGCAFWLAKFLLKHPAASLKILAASFSMERNPMLAFRKSFYLPLRAFAVVEKSVQNGNAIDEGLLSMLLAMSEEKENGTYFAEKISLMKKVLPENLVILSVECNETERQYRMKKRSLEENRSSHPRKRYGKEYCLRFDAAMTHNYPVMKRELKKRFDCITIRC